MKLKPVKKDKSYRLINHGPLVVVSSSDGKKETFTPIAWHMPVDFNPPLVAICVGKENFLDTLIRKSRVFCINILDAKFLSKIKKLGSVSGRDTDKLSLIGMKAIKCKKISCRYLVDSSGIIECKVKRIVALKGVDIFIGKVLSASACSSFEKGVWNLSKIKTVHHLGGGFFAVTKKL